MREVEDILLGGWKGKGERPCGLRKEKRARAGPRNNIQESPGFNKNIKKSGPLTMGLGGEIRVLLILVLALA